MSKSIARVEAAAARSGLKISVKRMGKSTRTAEEAANECGCDVSQIIKSLIFQGSDSNRLYLFLVPGDRQLNLSEAAHLTGEKLERADPRHIRNETGFAIGGVSPIGYDVPLPTYAEKSLLDHQTVWAAAGAHDAVFEAEPEQLLRAANAIQANIAQ